MKKTKKLASLVLAMIMCLTLCVPAMAGEAGEGSTLVQSDTSSQFDETLKTVFEYLENQSVPLDRFSEKVYNIPVGEGYVTVTMTTEQVQRNRYPGRDIVYNVVANSSYVSTLHIDSHLPLGGQIWYKVYFDTGDVWEPGTAKYKLRIVSVTFVVRVPDFVATDYATSIDRSYDNMPAGISAGVCKIQSSTTGLIREIQVRSVMSSMSNGTVIVDYTYDT